jgi:TonB-linked SusC/RagA family outer membrane protein
MYLLVAAVFTTGAYAHERSAQELLSKSVTLNVKDTALKTVLSQLQTQTNVKFAYSEVKIKPERKVSVQARDKELKLVLNEMLSPLDLAYEEVSGRILITQTSPKSSSPKPQEMSTEKNLVKPVQEIKGKVSDETGAELPGVSIIVKGTTQGTTTDIEGNFTLNVADDAILVFSFVGYISKEIPVEGQSRIEVVLASDTKALEELVVVGYGTQKKVNLTGAVSSIDIAKETQGRPVTSLSAGLAGLASGLSVNQGNGRPGGDGATLRIRGQGTLNNADPLVIIDGAVGDMNTLNPQDVESISVLKDAASASIYGSRAANGVILITTKKGTSGEMKVNYNSFFSVARPSNVVKTVNNYANYMELINEGFRNSDPNVSPTFSQEKIDLWRANENGDQLKYPNTEWTDAVFQKNLVQNHNLSFSGGSTNIRYFASLGYLDNPGVIEKSGFQRYNMRLNLEANIKPWLTLGANLNGVVSKTDIGTNILNDVFTFAGASTPGMVLRSPDGRYGGPNNPEDDPQANNVLHNLNAQKGDLRNNKLTSRFFGKIEPTKGLSIEGSYNYVFSDMMRYQQPVFNNRWEFINNTVTRNAVGRTSVTNQNTKDYQYYMDGLVRYEKQLVEGLTMNVMVGASQEHYKNSWFTASKLDLIDPSLGVLNAATLDASATGNISDWTMQSYFGRLNLNLKDKYLFEANLRRDGTSRFMAGKTRWGVFPSFSAAWRISEEDFFKVNWLTNLKARASYGSLGNNAVGNYEYQAVYNSANYILNNNLFVGFSQTALSNAMLTWESTYVANFGLDFGLFNNKLEGSLDVFDKQTKNILIDLPAPLVVGNASIPKQNSAQVQNRGIEMNLNYRNKINDFGYRIGGNFTFVDNKVTKYKGGERSISGANLIQEGYAINTQYLLTVDRIIQTDADLAIVNQMIENAPLDASGNKRNPFSAYGTPQKGDLLYDDNNGDGIINDDDRVTMGHGTAPRVSFGLSLGADWKGFDFSMLLQGSSGLQQIWHDLYHTTGTRWGYQINREVADGRWFDGRTDASYPRFTNYVDTRNTKNSDFWLQNKSYLRLKNIQLGYTIPSTVSKSLKISSVRVYGSLENYLTFTKYKGFDPEVSGTDYPTMKQMVFGVSVNF